MKMSFHPRTGEPMDEVFSRHAAHWRPQGTQGERRLRDTWRWLFNPWTGRDRNWEDIEVDPYGYRLAVQADPAAAAVKDSNPKDAIGDKKVPLWLLSPIAKVAWATARRAS